MKIQWSWPFLILLLAYSSDWRHTVSNFGGCLLFLTEVLVLCSLMFILMKFLHFRMKQTNGSYVPLRSSSSPLKSISSRSNIPLIHFKNGLSNWKRLKPTRKGWLKLQSLSPRDPVPMVALLDQDHVSLPSLRSVATGDQKDSHMRMTGHIYIQLTTMVPSCLVLHSTVLLTTLEATMEMGISTQPHIYISQVDRGDYDVS